MKQKRAKAEIVKLDNGSALTRTVRESLLAASRNTKHMGYTKALIIMAREDGTICYECAGLTDDERVGLMEYTKHLMLTNR